MQRERVLLTSILHSCLACSLGLSNGTQKIMHSRVTFVIVSLSTLFSVPTIAYIMAAVNCFGLRLLLCLQMSPTVRAPQIIIILLEPLEFLYKLPSDFFLWSGSKKKIPKIKNLKPHL